MIEAGPTGGIQLSSEIGRIQKQIIVFVGPEGSGKTTQAQLLANELGLPRVAMGDVFRELSKEDSDLGRRSRELFTEHKVSDIDLFEKAFKWRMQKGDVKNGFVLDGGLRFKEEVEELERLLEETGNASSIRVVYLRIPGWKSVERLLNRAREDDTEKGIFVRLTNHYNKLGERMSEARRKWPFSIVGVYDKTKEEIHLEIMEKIKGGEN